ncbi:hypothetical protein CesoFtcFv8_014510 [Champsocephalus esox]|uniref:Uncharacterized protein n=1 Tax=Champsocephalus esox TaxID=159716 RepID=A0AAN8BND4_9TELE|nr:hypothetical protein CesoFtcFv8_014510 [Champsocephalus esox]
MLVPVEYKSVSKWVRVPKVEDVYIYSEFLQGVLAKFNLPGLTSLMLKDSTGVEVDSDIFDELLNSSRVSFKAFTEEGNAAVQEILSTQPCIQSQVVTKSSRNMSLCDGTRRKMINILDADMVESHGRIPPVHVRITYALGITTLFPNLKDPDSKNGYEHFYDHQSGSGYLAWRLKTVQRNSAQEIEKSKVSFQGGPRHSMHSPVRPLSGDECNEAMSVTRHSSDITLVQDKMKATFQQRQKVVQDRATASTVLDLSPRFLDTSGSIEQDFTMLFGKEVSGTFLAKWPTFFKPRIIADCKNLPGSLHVDEILLSAQQESDDGGKCKLYGTEVAAILLLLHLLPPTSKGKKSRVKMSAKDAAGRLVKFLRVGKSIETFLKDTGPAQPFLLCVGERNDSIQHFYMVMGQKAIPCKTQTGAAAFDELFKAHCAFAVSSDEALCNCYTFIQTTVCGIDVGRVKESPRVKEIRARLLHSSV